MEMKKLAVVIAVTLLFVVSYNNLFATPQYTNVKAENENNQGYIFVGTGEKNQGVQLGEWQDPTTIPTLKGEKGDIGEQGIAGLNGIDGINGKDGLNGINGLNGKDGLNGEKGDTGEQGIQGVKGDIGAKGEQGERGFTGKGLKDRQEAQLEVRILDTRKTATSIYYIRDFNNQINTAGVKFTIKLGTSYEEREIKKLVERLNKIESK